MAESVEQRDGAEIDSDVPERFDLRSVLPTDERYEAIRSAYPEVFRESDIDFDALKRSLGEWINPGPERFGLTWPGKAECMRIIQEPSIGTLVPMPEESVDWDATQNVIIEGENLEVLKLLQKAYYGKVKLIYIDPPYNTGKEFIYPDNFREGLSDYLRYSGQVDEEGLRTSANPETAGRYHSNWLSMMYPRLFLARNLLRDDGAIALTIGDHEVHNLRHILNELFGEENFVANIVWQKKYTVSNDDPGVASMHDHILLYQRSSRFTRNLLPRTAEQLAAYDNPDQDSRGPWISNPIISNKSRHERPTMWYPIRHPHTNDEIWPDEDRVWRFSPSEYERLVRENRLYWGEDGSYEKPRLKRFLSEVKEGVVPRTWWTYKDAGSNDEGQRELNSLFGSKVFSAPKPTKLIERLLQICTGPSDIVLDYFAGSGTTGHAVMNHNLGDGGSRSFVLVQLPEPISNGEFAAISEITRERVRRAGSTMAKAGHLGLDSGFRSFRLTGSNFRVWDGSAETDIAEQLQIASDHVGNGDADSVLTELLLKAGFDLTTKVEEVEVAGYRVYSIADGELVVYIDSDLALKVVEAMVKMDPSLIIVADSSFGNDDELKVNALQTIRSHNLSSGTDITLKVV